MRKNIVRIGTNSLFLILIICMLCVQSFAHGNAHIRSNTAESIRTSKAANLDYISYAIENEFFENSQLDKFKPDDTMTRAVFADCLYRLDGMPPVEETHSFSDVESTSAYSTAISWAETYGITNGTSETTFSPDKEITKEQATVMLYRLADHQNFKTVYQSEQGESAAAQKWLANFSTVLGKNEHALTRSDAAKMLSAYDQTVFEENVDQHKMTLLYPSVPQLTICRGRDFYVIGDFDEDLNIPDNAKLQVTVTSKKTGKTLRTVYTNVKNNHHGMNVNYAGLNVEDDDREAFRYSMMPDLVYDPQKPDSFKYTWNKAFYSDEHFTCVVYGGNYWHDVWHFDQYNNWLGAMPEGDYTLEVTLSNNAEELAWYRTQISIGSTSDKVLSRFSPQEHMDNVTLYSDWKGYTLLLDPFPGYWNMPMFFPNWENNQYVGQIRQRWALADRQEYQTGRIHIFNYNITESSTSYSVEIGQLAYDRVLNDPTRVQYCFYDTGETFCSFIETDPNIDFPVFFTRIDHDSLKTPDNVWDMRSSSTFDSIDHPENNTYIHIWHGETVYFNGACYVLQPPKTQLLKDTESFSMNNANSVAYMAYEIYKNGIYQDVQTHHVSGLSRISKDGRTTKAILEFRHGIQFTEPGTYTIVASPMNPQGLGYTEADATQTFYVEVS